MGEKRFNLFQLKMDQIQKAFEVAQANTDVPGMKLVLVTETYYKKAMDFTREHFLSKEVTNKSLGVQYTAEYEEYWLKTLKDNLSLMLINTDDSEPVAIIRIRIQTLEDKLDLENIHAEPVQNKMIFARHCSSKADFFGYYGIKQAFHLIGLAVSEKYQKRGFATQIVTAALSMIRNLGIESVYIKAESSSTYAQKIFERTGFETLFEQPFDEWVPGDRILIQNTGVHKSRKVFGLKT